MAKATKQEVVLDVPKWANDNHKKAIARSVVARMRKAEKKAKTANAIMHTIIAILLILIIAWCNGHF